jgi:putative membrane protein
MKDLASKLLSASDRDRIDASIQAAEQMTSGEIVCLIQSASYHYPMADVIGGVALALPAALILTPAIGGLFWIGEHNMWLFLGLFAVLYLLSHLLVRNLAPLKRRFISRREIDEEIEEAAVNAFFRNGLYRTRDANGVLLFVSVFERRVSILADYGVSAKVDQSQWNEVVEDVVQGIKHGHPAEAICAAVGRVGKMLRSHFPAKTDDTDELNNLIVPAE